MGSYDERQINKPLRICAKCQRPFYMNGPICGQCGPGWRTSQHPEPRKTDVSGNVMEGD